MTEHDLPVLGSTIHWVEEGRGDPIVFLHGNPTSSYLWRNVMPRLRGEGRLLAPDLIGMGKSGKPDGDYRFPMHARYLDAWLDAMDLRNATLVIHDWGSALGIYWARRHAERVAAIAMMEAIVEPIGWNEFPKDFVPLFQAFRTPGVGEKLVLEQNQFIEVVLPGAILRKLTDEEMNVYRAPFREPATRLPTLAWPRCLPIGGEPAAVTENDAGCPSTAVMSAGSFVIDGATGGLTTRVAGLLVTVPAALVIATAYVPASAGAARATEAHERRGARFNRTAREG